MATAVAEEGEADKEKPVQASAEESCYSEGFLSSFDISFSLRPCLDNLCARKSSCYDKKVHSRQKESRGENPGGFAALFDKSPLFWYVQGLEGGC
jgi:hypothetical protein